jgi:hypothetical protein
LQAVDLDVGENAVISYYQIGRIQQTLTEGLENVQKPPFLVNKETGAVLLNFDPQKGMKGYFDFMVSILLTTVKLITKHNRVCFSPLWSKLFL